MHTEIEADTGNPILFSEEVSDLIAAALPEALWALQDFNKKFKADDLTGGGYRV